MKLNNRINEVRLGGFLANVDIKQGQHGPFGSVTITVDDGYYSKGHNGQQGEWVDRSYFIHCEVSSNNMPDFQKGDYLEIQGSLIVDFWQGNDGPKQTLKVKARKFLVYVPKVACECLKQAGLYGKPKQATQSQHPQHGQSQAQRPQQGHPQQPSYGEPPASYQDDNPYPQHGSGQQNSMPPQQGGWGNGQRPPRRAQS